MSFSHRDDERDMNIFVGVLITLVLAGIVGICYGIYCLIGWMFG